MTSIRPTNCPTWCTKIHDQEEVNENDYFHGRTFGCYEDGTPGTIKFGVCETNSQLHSPEVLIDTVFMTTAQDLRDLARDCIEAAEWIEKTLPDSLNLVSYGH